MNNEERKEIEEKRSSLRSWRERHGKSYKGEIIGAALIGLIIIALIASSYWNDAEGKSQSLAGQMKEPAPQNTSSTSSGPAPGITIYSPENTTYDTDTPSLNFIAAGSNLNIVRVSVDGGQWIQVSHDGTIAKLDFARLDPLFIDDFSGITNGGLKETGYWNVAEGKYVTTGGTSGFGDPEWNDYIVEAKTRIISGKDVSVDFRWDGGNNYYRVQTTGPYENLMLHKMDDKGYATLSSAKLTGINPAAWHTWKIIAEGSRIQVFIDGSKYIDYTDIDKPYLKGNSRLRVLNASVEYDHVQVYRPLSKGEHELTVFANNTAGIAFSKAVNFGVNATSAGQGDNVGKIGQPLILNGLEVTVKNVETGGAQTSIWLSVKNADVSEIPFKLVPSPVIMDSAGNQYENVKVARSAEITQTTLYPDATREGAVFFEKFKEGTRPKKLLLYVNGDKFEFALD